MMNNDGHIPETTTAGDGKFSAEGAQRSELLELEAERLRQELEAERERVLRALADFDNYRRRVRKERASAEQAGKRHLLLSLLDLMDDFDRAVGHIGEATDPVADGLRLIHQRLGNVLESNGVTSFQSKGQEFDPTAHEATSVIQGDEYESGTVYEEDRRGYLWNGELLRPARVTVVR